MYVLYLKVNLISGDEMVFMELGYLCPDGYKEKIYLSREKIGKMTD